ncbi:MAG: protein kinase [Candidatus Sumerlaeota bacterium]|nr:protein kinase [Candidatus Sumerlaeota bacterium]
MTEHSRNADPRHLSGSTPFLTTSGIHPGDLILDRYQIVEQIGAGGFGEVWLARDKEQQDELRALKIVPRNMRFDQSAVELLKREGRLLGRLNHSNIVRVYDCLLDQHGNPVIVLRYVPGWAHNGKKLRDLKDWLDHSKKLSESDIRAILLPILDGLQYAHTYRDTLVANGMVHRDLKPSNILLDRDGQPIIADFRIAHRIQTMTRAYTSVLSNAGTIQYMSPEQVRGRNIGPQSDIYSLGIMLYELLTGAPPFVEGDIGYQHVHEAVPPLSGVSLVLGAIIQRSLEKDPRRRWPSCLVMINILLGTISPNDVSYPEDETLSKGESFQASTTKQQSHGQNSLQHEVEQDIVEVRNLMMQGKPSSEYLADQGSRVSIWKQAAELGIPAGQYLWGLCYFNGIGTGKSESQAANWFQKAAIQEYPLGQRALGYCLSNGTGMPEDKHTGAKWFREAAEKGCPLSQYELGLCLSNGLGATKDEYEAVRWFRKAAEQGVAGAQASLAVCFLHGIGIPKDEYEAARWYRESAEQGYSYGQYGLAFCLLQGAGAPKNEYEGVTWCRKAAEQGNADAQSQLGYCLQEGIGLSKAESEAFKWYQKAAEQGNTAGETNLGCCYENGIGVTQDVMQAIHWYHKAADRGEATACYNLCLIYGQGNGVPKDATRSAQFCETAAQNGNIDAQRTLGLLYGRGQGIRQDYYLAEKWLKKAAERGDIVSKRSLGWLYLMDKCGEGHTDEGLAYLVDAASDGDEQATEMLQKIADGGPQKKKKCIIATATWSALGYPDDCVELQQMRHVRDTYMRETPERLNEVRRYYHMAPILVELIESLPRPVEEYQRIAQEYLVPITALLTDGRNGEARSCFHEMLQDLYTRHVLPRLGQ